MKKILDETNYMRRLMGLNLLNEQDANESSDNNPIWMEVVEGLGKDKFKISGNIARHTNNVDKFKINIGKDGDNFGLQIDSLQDTEEMEYDKEGNYIPPQKLNDLVLALTELPEPTDWMLKGGTYQWEDLGLEYKDKVINALKDKI